MKRNSRCRCLSVPSRLRRRQRDDHPVISSLGTVSGRELSNGKEQQGLKSMQLQTLMTEALMFTGLRVPSDALARPLLLPQPEGWANTLSLEAAEQHLAHVLLLGRWQPWQLASH